MYMRIFPYTDEGSNNLSDKRQYIRHFVYLDVYTRVRSLLQFQSLCVVFSQQIPNFFLQGIINPANVTSQKFQMQRFTRLLQADINKIIHIKNKTFIYYQDLKICHTNSVSNFQHHCLYQETRIGKIFSIIAFIKKHELVKIKLCPFNSKATKTITAHNTDAGLGITSQLSIIYG